MSPAEHAGLWKAEPSMLFAVNCHCSYMLKADRWMPYDIFWRTRTEFPLSSPVSDKRHGGIMARFHSNQTAFMGSWMGDQCNPAQPFISAALPRDREEITECFNGSLRTAAFVDDLMVENEYYFEREDTFSISNEAEAFTDSFDPVEEPWLLCTPASSGCATQDVSASRDLMDTDECLTSLSSERLESKPLSNTSLEHSGSFSDMHHPVEEPWLLFSSLESSETNNESESIDSITRTPVQYENTSLAHEEQQHQSSEELLPERDYNQLSFEDTVSTEILINSSVCTMQRIAVLEDGNLVELLLEPVKSNVQCGSVYLGVVTKLVPHMGGALVNIGSSRPSLMDIKHNREPFIFPPVGFDSKGKDISGFWSSTLNEYSGTKRVEQSPSDVSEVYPNDAEVEYSYMPDDLGDNEGEDDVDVDVEDLQVPNLVDEIDTSLDDTSSHLDVNVNASYMKSHSDQGDRKSKDVCSAECAWDKVRKSTKIIVQVVKEGLGTKGPTLTAYPKLKSRFWVLSTRCNTIGVSKKILGVERTRLRVIAKSLQPPDFGLTVRTVAMGRSIEELHKDLEGLLSTWRNIVEHAKSAALAAVEGVEGAVPVILHQAMGQTLSVVQDYFSEKVKRMVVDSPRTYHEVTSYLQEIAPNLCDRVELHSRKVPLFVEFNIEEEINNILNKRVPLPNGGSLVIEQTEALVSIDVNGGHGMFGEGNSQENAVLDVNLAAAKQIARELRLRDIGGIIVVDFIDMLDDSNKRLVYEEVKKAVERDRSMVKVSELSKHGLMEITRKRVRPSVTFMVSEPCACCHGTGRVEALETSFSKIEHEICRLLAMMDQKADPEKPKSWPRLILRVDRELSDYLTSGRRTRVATLSSSLKVWILLKVARSFTRGTFEVKVFQDDKLNNSVQAAEPQISTPINRTKLFPIKRWKTRRI